MGMASRIFLRNGVARAVDKIYRDMIKLHIDTFLDFATLDGSKLIHYLAMPIETKPISSPLFQEIMDSLLEEEFSLESPELSSVDIDVFKKRHQFLKILKLDGFDSDEPDTGLRPFEVEKLSMHATCSSTAMAIKNYWICKFVPIEPDHPNGVDARWTASRPYHGILPFTSPIKKFFKHLYGSSSFSVLDVTILTNEIANEIDRDPLWVNTAQWHIGREM
jgi:hypothetical protein